jgi:hypothetical protein
VASRIPFSVKECSIGSGALCGAIFLYKNFEARKLGTPSDSILTKRRLKEAINYFEEHIKKEFNPYDSSFISDDFNVPMRNAADIPSVGLEDGYLKLIR